MDFTKRDIERRFRRSRFSYDEAAAIQAQMAEGLAGLIFRATFRREFDRMFEIGCGSGLLTKQLVQCFDYRELLLNDLVPEHAALAGTLPRAKFLPGDIETLELPESLELVAANAALQWLRAPAALFRRLAGVINSDGILAFSVFGPENFKELRELTGIGLDYPSQQQYLEMLEEYFTPIAVHEEKIELFFDTPEAVLRHLKSTGVTATGAGAAWTRAKLRSFAENYQKFRSEAGYRLTYHPLLLCLQRTATPLPFK